MTYSDTVDYLYGLQGVGIKLGLDNMTRLLQAAGNPQRAFPAIHVGGTNGKGSTAALIASYLRRTGRRTGLFSSPHLVDFTERITVDGRMISESEVIRLTDRFRRVADDLGLQPTFFEITTAIAFETFRLEKVDGAVVEVGLGGRLDSTNVIKPMVSVITNVSRDHEAFLGESIDEIAVEKAGIIKPGVPVVTGARTRALEIIEETAVQNGAPLYVLGRDFEARDIKPEADGTAFSYRGPGVDLPGLRTTLLGRHQAENASLALTTLKAAGLLEFPDPEAVNEAFELRWPGRLEKIASNPAILLDSAHNEAAAEALVSALKDHFPGRRIVLVIGMMKDKKPEGVLRTLASVAYRMILTTPDYERAAQPTTLEEVARRYLDPARVSREKSIASALDRAVREALSDDVIVVTGSFFTTGEAKERFQGPGILSALREAGPASSSLSDR